MTIQVRDWSKSPVTALCANATIRYVPAGTVVIDREQATRLFGGRRQRVEREDVGVAARDGHVVLIGPGLTFETSAVKVIVAACEPP